MLAISFASTGKEYKLFTTLYRSLRNRGVEFKEESEVDVFTPNLSEEVMEKSPTGAQGLRRVDFIDSLFSNSMYSSQKLICRLC